MMPLSVDIRQQPINLMDMNSYPCQFVIIKREKRLYSIGDLHFVLIRTALEARLSSLGANRVCRRSPLFWFLGTHDTDKKLYAGNFNISSGSLKL